MMTFRTSRLPQPRSRCRVCSCVACFMNLCMDGRQLLLPPLTRLARLARLQLLLLLLLSSRLPEPPLAQVPACPWRLIGVSVSLAFGCFSRSVRRCPLECPGLRERTQEAQDVGTCVLTSSAYGLCIAL
jgi:hypothetical protein